MPVLKAQQHPSFVKDAIVLDLGDIGRQAARLRMLAEQKASSVLAQAERQAAEMTAGAEAKGFEAGQSRGFEQGLAEGRQRGQAEALMQMKPQLEAIQVAWSDAAVQLDGQRRQIHREATQAVIDFALKLAQRLVHRIVEVDSTVIVDQVAASLAQVLSPLDVVVAVHPEDRPVLEKALPELTAEFGHLQHIRLIEKDDVSRGGCIVNFAEGQVDATLETQFSRIVDLMVPAGNGGDADAAEPRDPDEPKQAERLGEAVDGGPEAESRMNVDERE